MNARDELALILVNTQRARYTLPPRTTTEHCSESCWAEADAILAAGYRKPRTVSTVAELDALPVGSVILDRDGMSLHKTPWDLSGTGWNASNGTCDVGREEIEAGCFPAAVLYIPDAPTETGTQA